MLDLEKLNENLNQILNSKFKQVYLQQILGEALELGHVQEDLRSFIRTVVNSDLVSFTSALSDLSSSLEKQLEEKESKLKLKQQQKQDLLIKYQQQEQQMLEELN